MLVLEMSLHVLVSVVWLFPLSATRPYPGFTVCCLPCADKLRARLTTIQSAFEAYKANLKAEAKAELNRKMAERRQQLELRIQEESQAARTLLCRQFMNVKK